MAEDTGVRDEAILSVVSVKLDKEKETENAKRNDGLIDDSGRKPECAICLQTCIHPVKLPCRHIFCFLCVKGIANQSKRCAMCRQEIPPDYLDKPNLLSTDDIDLNFAFEDGNQWFYEGRNGWWQYDERTSSELEASYKRGDTKCEVLVAGFLYIVDFQHMVQMRRNDLSRRRKIKRDFATICKKGVAGIRVGPAEEGVEDDSWMAPRTYDAAESGGYLSVTRVKLPSTTPATPSNTPQTPVSGTDASVPSSPGRSTLSGSLDQSLVDALHTLHVLDGEESQQRREAMPYTWDISYTDDEQL